MCRSGKFSTWCVTPQKNFSTWQTIFASRFVTNPYEWYCDIRMVVHFSKKKKKKKKKWKSIWISKSIQFVQNGQKTHFDIDERSRFFGSVFPSSFFYVEIALRGRSSVVSVDIAMRSSPISVKKKNCVLDIAMRHAHARRYKRRQLPAQSTTWSFNTVYINDNQSHNLEIKVAQINRC